jgi:mRNA interferase HigB
MRTQTRGSFQLPKSGKPAICKARKIGGARRREDCRHQIGADVERRLSYGVRNYRDTDSIQVRVFIIVDIVRCKVRGRALTTCTIDLAALGACAACAQFGRMLVFGMRIIARRTLREFVEGRRGYKNHGALKAALDAWFDEVKKARWSGAADVKRSYATASIVSADRIVFNIKGNDYRLVVAIDFEKGIAWIKWIGTHRDYDKIDVKEVQHGG